MSAFRTNQQGFTLIEMIVSLALFSVVVTVAVGALLMLVGTNEELQGEQSVMTNLSFALDSMTREIRTGTDYYCVSSSVQNGFFNDSNSLETLGDSNLSCPNGNSSGLRFHGIIFKEAGESITGSGAERIMYYFDDNTEQIYRRVGAGAAQPIVSTGVSIQDADFFVSSAQSLEDSGDSVQPAVTIHIEALDNNSTAIDQKTYFIQTTITQRTLDL